MLAERVQRELSAAQSDIKAASERPSSVDGDPQIQKLAQLVRRLAGEQKKLVHEIAKVTRPEPTDTPRESDALLLASQAITEMQKELARINRERKAERPERSQRFDELHAQLAALRKAVSKPARRKRTKGESARVGVFVDVQNVYYAARRLKGKLDFDALIETAVGRRRLIQATAYVVESKEIDQSGFIALLQQRGFEVRRKNLRVRADGSMKGDWDMELALDILDEAPHLDVVVLVSGDGDFTSLVGKVKRMGPRVEVIGFPRQTATSCEDFHHPRQSRRESTIRVCVST